MGKTSKINSFFKRVNVSPTEENVGSSVDHVTIDTPSPPTKIQRIDTVEFDIKISIDLVRRLAFQAMPFRGHDEKSTSNNRGKYKKMSRVYIGNLDERVSERDLEDDFRSFGVIRNVWVARRPPGYAFIDFDDKRDAQDAIRECDGKNGWKVEMSHNSRNGGGGDRGGRGGGRGRSGGSDLKCYECGEAGHFARECRSRGGGGGGGGRRRSRSRTPPSRYRKSPSYGQRSPSPRARSLKRRSLSPRGRSYSRSPLPYRGREEVPYANGNGRDRYRSRS